MVFVGNTKRRRVCARQSTQLINKIFRCLGSRVHSGYTFFCTMFTGIIEATAAVLAHSNGKLELQRPQLFDDVSIGSSIAVSGVCLSIVKLDDATMTFDVIPETYSKTTLESLQQRDRVNLERAMKADARLDGHIVQGHVEGVGTVLEVDQTSGVTVTIQLPDDLRSPVVAQGSIAIDGVSLTVASIEDGRCAIALIPHTLEHTTLGTLHVRDSVNVETDVLVR